MKDIQRITSAANPIVRLTHAIVHSQHRAAKEGLFAVEGLRLAEMAAASDWTIRHAIVTEHAMTGARAKRLIDVLCTCGVRVALVADALFSPLSETDSPQGILLVTERKQRVSLDEMHAGAYGDAPPLYIVLDRVQDPGNIGTILRTADAVSAAGVILLRGSADIYSGKVVRATMGALFHVPFAVHVTAEALMRFAQEKGMDLLATACDGESRTHFESDLRRPAVIVFGNEANGVSEEILRASEHIYIPMRGYAESLNVSAAATAVMYEALRQRIYS